MKYTKGKFVYNIFLNKRFKRVVLHILVCKLSHNHLCLQYFHVNNLCLLMNTIFVQYISSGILVYQHSVFYYHVELRYV